MKIIRRFEAVVEDNPPMGMRGKHIPRRERKHLKILGRVNQRLFRHLVMRRLHERQFAHEHSSVPLALVIPINPHGHPAAESISRYGHKRNGQHDEVSLEGISEVKEELLLASVGISEYLHADVLHYSEEDEAGGYVCGVEYVLEVGKPFVVVDELIVVRDFVKFPQGLFFGGFCAVGATEDSCWERCLHLVSAASQDTQHC